MTGFSAVCCRALTVFPQMLRPSVLPGATCPVSKEGEASRYIGRWHRLNGDDPANRHRRGNRTIDPSARLAFVNFSFSAACSSARTLAKHMRRSGLPPCRNCPARMARFGMHHWSWTRWRWPSGGGARPILRCTIWIGIVIHKRAVPTASGGQRHYLFHEPGRQRLGQFGDGELLLLLKTERIARKVYHKPRQNAWHKEARGKGEDQPLRTYAP